MASVRVLFVCVENAGRSQMAEGFARKLGGGALEAWSAGSKPSGRLNEKAVAVMREAGIDISSQRSKGFPDLPYQEWDFVVTMGCGDACPFVPGRERLDWAIPDPRNQDLDEVRRIRDIIAAAVKGFLSHAQRKNP